MSNLSDLLPSGGGSKSAEFVASGTLPNGQAVILNSNGTVTAVGTSTQTVPIAVPTGSVTAFTSDTLTYSDVSWDGSTGHFVIVWKDSANSNYGTARIGTVAGNVITFSSTTYVFNSERTNAPTVEVDPNTPGKFVIVWGYSTGSQFKGIVGNYTGTGTSASMTFGSVFLVANIDPPDYVALAYDKNTAGRFVVMFQGPTNAGQGVCGNIASGATTVTMGSVVTWASQGSAPHPKYVMSIYYDKTADKFITPFGDGANSNALNAIVGTISSTDTLTFGTRTTSSITNTGLMEIAGDPLRTNSSVIAYAQSGPASALVATLSGTTVSFGTPAAFSAAGTYRVTAMMGSGTQDIGGLMWVELIGGSNYVRASTFTVSGTSLSIGTTYNMTAGDGSGSPNYLSSDFNPAQSGQFVGAYYDAVLTDGVTQLGQLLVGSQQTTNLTTTNFVGMPDAAYSSGATATVALQGGISLNQTSLTIGSTYFVQDNGTLGTSAGTVNVEAGRAISATSLLIKGI